MWFCGAKHSTSSNTLKPFENSSATKRKSLTDITCEVVNRTPSLKPAGNVQPQDEGCQNFIFQHDIQGSTSVVDDYDRPRAIVAGTKPFRFMIEATVEVHGAAARR